MGSVASIIIDNIMKDLETTGKLPWQRPYEMFESFNWVTKQPYKGINRLILPNGEYLTKNQINEYNKTHDEDFRFQKGIKWYPITFYKVDTIEVQEDAVIKAFQSNDLPTKGFIGYGGGYSWYAEDGRYFKSRRILQYYRVAERKHFRNSKGELLPSRLDTGEVVITHSKPQGVFYDYVDREGIKLIETLGSPFYRPSEDTIGLNNYHKEEEEYWSSCFHEAAHSTGAVNRLNREALQHISDKDLYAKEECVAEITASLLCSECGIATFSTSESRSYSNSLAYINHWKERIKDWGESFIYIVHQADLAFNYIMGINSV